MNRKKTEAFTPDEALDNWKSMSKDKKIKFFTESPTEIIKALTELMKEFDKAEERVSSLVKSRNEALIRLLEKGDWSIDEVERIVALMDEGVKMEVESKDKGNNQKLKITGIAGGIVLILSGAVTIKANKKAGLAMIASGATLLLGVAGSETKTVKAIMASLNDTQNVDVVEA